VCERDRESEKKRKGEREKGRKRERQKERKREKEKEGNRVLLGCNNGIGEFHKNLVTFRGPKLPDF